MCFSLVEGIIGFRGHEMLWEVLPVCGSVLLSVLQPHSPSSSLYISFIHPRLLWNRSCRTLSIPWGN
jgi:hypothetical protein